MYVYEGTCNYNVLSHTHTHTSIRERQMFDAWEMHRFVWKVKIIAIKNIYVYDLIRVHDKYFIPICREISPSLSWMNIALCLPPAIHFPLHKIYIVKTKCRYVQMDKWIVQSLCFQLLRPLYNTTQFTIPSIQWTLSKNETTNDFAQ